MNDTRELDPFETALLAELRRGVAEHPAPAGLREPAARRSPRRRLRIVAATVATGTAASVAAAFGLGALGGSPAFAVDTDPDGDVVVTVHRLDDATGLEQALEQRGIDADVSYDPSPSDGTSFGIGTGPDAGPPTPLPDHFEHGEVSSGAGGEPGPTLEQGPVASGPGADAGVDPGADPCGLAPGSTPPASLRQEGSDWVLRIPADSPLQDRHIDIGTTSDGVLTVAYEGDEPHSLCGLMQRG